MAEFYPHIKVKGKRITMSVNSTDTSYTENVCILPPNAYVIGRYGRVKTAFTGLTKPTVSLGVSGDTARYMAAQPINRVGDFVFGKYLKSSAGIRKDATSLPDKYKKDLPHSMGFCEAMKDAPVSSAYLPIIATFSTSDSDMTGYTAGEVEFVIVYIDPNE